MREEEGKKIVMWPIDVKYCLLTNASEDYSLQVYYSPCLKQTTITPHLESTKGQIEICSVNASSRKKWLP